MIFKGYIKLIKYVFKFFLYIKMLNNYYQKHKEKPQKVACERYQSFSLKEKDIRQKRPEKQIKILLKR